MGMNLIIVLTGCISPTKEQPYILLTDREKRLKQYLDSIKYYIETTESKKIVFCDSSNCKYEKNWNLIEKAKESGKEFEWLSFQEDNEYIRTYGKGWGEGSILKFVCENSRLYKSSDYIIKITGRLKIQNIRQIEKKLNYKYAFFNTDIYRPRGLDTRLFACSKDFFERELKEVFKECDDSKDNPLEEVYYKYIFDKVTNLPHYPIIDGKSASNGQDYHIPIAIFILLESLCRIRCFNKSIIVIKDMYRKIRKKKLLEVK